MAEHGTGDLRLAALTKSFGDFTAVHGMTQQRLAIFRHV